MVVYYYTFNFVVISVVQFVTCSDGYYFLVFWLPYQDLRFEDAIEEEYDSK